MRLVQNDLLVDNCSLSARFHSARYQVGLTLPRRLIDIEARNGTLEVSRVGQTVRTERAQVRELEMGAEDLEDVLGVCASVAGTIKSHAYTHSRERGRPEGRPKNGSE